MSDVDALVQEAASWPLEKRISHSNWKVRSHAFEYISEQMSSIRDSMTMDVVEETRGRVEGLVDGHVLAKAVGDPNANVMDKALDAYCDYIDVLGRLMCWSERRLSVLEKQADVCMGQVTSKCLKASKRSTIQKSIAVCMMLVEVDQGYVVMNRIVEDGFTHKVPKAVAASLEVVREAVESFAVSCDGFDEVEYSKIILNGMVASKVYSHAQAAVRNVVKDILAVLMRRSKRIEAAVKGILWDTLPDAMKKEVLDMVASGGSDQVVKRYTKKQQMEMSTDDVEMMDVDDDNDNADDGGVHHPVDVVDADVDPYEFVDPKNIMPVLHKSRFSVGDDEEDVAFWDCFGSKKWNVRKSAVEKVCEVVDGAVRLEPQNGEYSTLVRELKQILVKDANIHCAATAAAAAEAMGKALRQDFHSYAKQLCPAILNRFKEKNPVMSQAADSCLESFGTYCYSLKDVSDDITTALGHKNPKVCADTLRYLSFLVKRESKQNVTQCKDSLSAAVKLVPGADVKIREEAQNVVVGFAVKMGGFAAMKPYLNVLDDKKKGYLEKAVGEAMVSAKQQGGGSAEVAAQPRVKKPAVSKSTTIKKKPAVPTKAAMPAKKVPPAVAKKTSSSSDVGLVENQLAAEQAEEYLGCTFGPEIIEGLKSSLWQERLGSISQIAEKTSEVLQTNENASNLLLCLAKIPGWEDKNFQVINKLFEISTKVAEESKPRDFGIQHASCIVQGAVEKIHEIKHRAQATSALNSACERVGPRFVVSCVHQKAATHKNPKVMSECLFWMTKSIEQFGYNQIDNCGSIAVWMNEDLGSSNPSVKSQALALLGECHAQVGPDPFQSLMNTLKPALVTSLQETFAKKPVDSSYEPSKTVSQDLKDLPIMADIVTRGEDDICVEEEDHSIDAAEDVVTDRVDVSGRFNDSLISQLNSSNWKERNAAVDSVAEIVSSSRHITPEIPSDLLSAIKARFGDANRNLAAKSFSVVGMLAAAVGEPFDKLAHGILLGPAVSNLADSKKQVREAVVGMLDAWGNTCPKERLFPALAEAVSNPKGAPEGRVSALKWMIDNYSQNSKCKEVAIKASAVASRDKAAEVRNMAAKLEALCNSGAVSNAPRKTPAKVAPTKAPSVARTPARSVVKEKSAKSRLGLTPAPKSAAKQRLTQDIEEDEGPLIRMIQGKGSRNKQYRPKPGGFEQLSASDKTRLKELLQPVVSTSLYAKMFSRDFKDHVEAADILIDAVPTHLGEMVTSLDLFLQWSVLILCEANTQSSMKTLDLLNIILQNLSDDGYRLTDMEASILLPAVIEKSGQNQDYLRSAYRSIIVLVASVYNPAKVIDYIVQGLVTKNSRTKVECCTALSEIVQENGSRCIMSSKQKPVAATSQFVKERDPALRAAAMNTLQLIYNTVGNDQFIQLLKNVREDDREIIESKLQKVSQQPSSPVPDVQPMDITPAASRFQAREEYFTQETNDHVAYMPHNLEMTPESGDSFGEKVQPTRHEESIQQAEPTKTPVSNMLRAPIDSINIDTPVPAQLKTTPGVVQEPAYSPPPYNEEEFEQRWMKSIDAMYTTDLSVSVEAAKQICSDLMAITSKDVAPPSRRILAVLGSSADKFVLGICAHLEIIFADAIQQVKTGAESPSARGCKFALNALLQGLRIREIAMNIPQPTLRTSISLLLCSLVDEFGLLCFDEGTTLVRAVNVLIKNLLDSADKNYSFAALLHLLRSPPRSLNPNTLPKFNDLVVKCLIKLTKGIDSQTTDIDIAFLLLCLHDYFMFLGVEEIRKRSAAEDKPLRMVKTILHQICKVTGYNVYQYTSGIPGRHSQPQPIIFRYIDINLKMLKEMNQLPSEPISGAIGNPAKTVDASPYPMATRTESSAEEEAKSKLKNILSRVTSRDESTKEGAMRELLDIKQQHPRMLDKYLRGTQDRFRNYIEESLEILESSASLSSASSSGRIQAAYLSKGSKGDGQLSAPQVSSVDMLAERMARLKQHLHSK